MANNKFRGDRRRGLSGAPTRNSLNRFDEDIKKAIYSSPVKFFTNEEIAAYENEIGERNDANRTKK